MLGVSPAGWHSYMHVVGWVTVVKGEAQAQERFLLVLLSAEKVPSINGTHRGDKTCALNRVSSLMPS